MSWENRYLNRDPVEEKRARRPEHYLQIHTEWTGESRAHGSTDFACELYVQFDQSAFEAAHMLSGLLKLKRPVYPEDQWHKLIEVLPLEARSHHFKLWGIRAVARYADQPHTDVEIWGGSTRCDAYIESVIRPNKSRDVGVAIKSIPGSQWKEVRSNVAFRPVQDIWSENELDKHFIKFGGRP